MSTANVLDTARNQSFGYDALQRLTDADGIYGDIDYGYDAVGNRTSRTVTSGRTPGTETLTYDSASNRLLTVAGGGSTRTLTYAADGSISQDDTGTAVIYDLGYNQAGRLAALDEGGQAKADYLYNAAGQRVAKTVIGLPNVVTHYHYDRDGRLLAESDGQGNALREYIHLDGLPLALVDDLQATPAIYFVHADHLGAPQKMTDGAQALVWDAIHTPFGRLHGITGPAANAQRLPGQLFDPETGYHQNWHRDYDPQTGRYLQSDPIGLRGGINTYAYVGGNPLRYVDPLGLEGEPQGWPDWAPKLPLSDEKMRGLSADQKRELRNRLRRAGNHQEARKIQKKEKMEQKRNKRKQRGGPKMRLPRLPIIIPTCVLMPELCIGDDPVRQQVSLPRQEMAESTCPPSL